MIHHPRQNKIKAVDSIVAEFTKRLLPLARKENVGFAYAGNKGNASDEINRVMNINRGVVRELLK